MADTIVVTGPGVEDSRQSSYGHVVRSLVANGREVFCFDPHVARTLSADNSFATQWHWLINKYQPITIVSIESHDPFQQEAVNAAEASGTHVVRLAQDDLARCFIESLPSTSATLELRKIDSDVVIVANGSNELATLARDLTNNGTSVCLLGEDWESFDTATAKHQGRPPYEHLTQTLKHHRLAITCDVVSAFDATNAGLPAVSMSDLPHFTAIGSFQQVIDLLNDSLRCDALIRSATAFAQERSWAQYWRSIFGEPQVRVTKDGPTATFITGLYDTREYVGTMIESLLNQTSDDFELLVMNDGAKDDSVSIVEKYLGDSRIKLINQQNIGQTGRFDFIWRGLMPYARGKFVGGFGTDDIAMPNRLERQLSTFADEPGIDVLHTGGLLINSNGDVTGNAFELDYSYDSSNLLRRLVRGNNIAMPTVLMRREVFDTIGMWNGGFAADYRMWLELARFARFRYLPEALTAYRVHDKSASTESGGANNDKAMHQGLLTRLDERNRLSITDMYPTLLDVDEDNKLAYAAAYIDLGNGHLRYIASCDAALHEYEIAQSICPELRPYVNLNSAIAFALDGRFIDAENYLRLACEKPDIAAANLQLNGLGIHSLVHAAAISNAPFELSAERASNTYSWDGTVISQRRILVIPNWGNDAGIHQVIGCFAQSTSESDDIELVFPTSGLDTPLAVGILERAAAAIDTSKCAPISLELWDDLSFVPMERFSLVVNMFDQQMSLDNMQQTLTSLRDSQQIAVSR